MRLTILFSLVISLSRSLVAAENAPAVLQRQTQELFDAIPSGSAPVWGRYLDERASYTDEAGAVLAKEEMVEQLKPFPKEITGNVKVTDFRVTLHGSVAITTHLDDEHETYYGHELHCQYRTTDTWIRTSAGWRLIATQVLALRTDPPPLRLTAPQIQEYVGRYALAKSKTYEIRMKDGDLEGQETGRAPEGLRAEVVDPLFVPGKPRYRKVFLRDQSGRITGFAERREAWDLLWKHYHNDSHDQKGSQRWRRVAECPARQGGGLSTTPRPRQRRRSSRDADLRGLTYQKPVCGQSQRRRLSAHVVSVGAV